MITDSWKRKEKSRNRPNTLRVLLFNKSGISNE